MFDEKRPTVPRIGPLLPILLLAALASVTITACTAEPVIERGEVTRVVPEQDVDSL